MQSGMPSISAQRVALHRAAHQLLDHPLVFPDPLAVAITGEEGAALAQSTPKPLDFESRFIRAFMVARSRYAEDQLAAAVAKGVKQYVILGAGLDTFAYRYSDKNFSVFEVDHPATQRWKRQRLAAVQIHIPPQLTFVPVDFENSELSQRLTECGLQKNLPTYFSWLGVTPYLTPEAFESTLRMVASMPAGSGVTFDYAVVRSSLGTFEQTTLDKYSHRLAAIGEPFRLFFEPVSIAADMKKFGFSRVEDLASPDINDRYFKDRADGLRVFGGFAHLLSAWV